MRRNPLTELFLNFLISGQNKCCIGKYGLYHDNFSPKKKKTNRICNVIMKTVNASVFIVSTNSVACIAWWFPISSQFDCPLLTHLGLFARPTKTAILHRLLTVTHKCCHRVQRIFYVWPWFQLNFVVIFYSACSCLKKNQIWTWQIKASCDCVTNLAKVNYSCSGTTLQAMTAHE